MAVLKVEWLLTRACQLKCDYCKIRDASTLGGKQLTKEQVFEGVDIINRRFPRVPIVFFGGEPTVLNWLPELVGYCEALGVKYAVISNSERVLKDELYFQALIDNGISNWSVSIDTLSGLNPTNDSELKSQKGFQALKKFRDAGVRDLVACITVTKENILEVPSIIRKLSTEGIWGITTPLQIGDDSFEYSGKTDSLQCRDEGMIRSVASKLKEMALSGEYLMHNAPEFYDMWDTYFVKQNWKCTSKSALTIDADGSLKRCVDKKGGLDKFSIFDLDSLNGIKRYEREIEEPHKCKGCFWDPAVETTLRSKIDRDAAVGSFRHDLTEVQKAKLSPESRRWFL